jgi:hypothetical protein
MFLAAQSLVAFGDESNIPARNFVNKENNFILRRIKPEAEF